MNGQRDVEGVWFDRFKHYLHSDWPAFMKGQRETDFAYQAVYRYLTSLINEMATEAPIKLPSLRQLADRLNVSISTIQYA
ncbi:hypothetical protein AO353_24120 [Pseudomonas fluorescens]|uniref:HTH gntR-type domain-containing protein n=1 Tax=Pseudomonas fluorescens TaxID=294 RepID=A0A0N9VZ75_PSEFL|nr:hypothetical protein AO353_24120 [Pseudomonas fluorescens]